MKPVYRQIFQWVLNLVGLLYVSSTAMGQQYDTLRVMTYNLLNYPGNSSAVRNPEFRKTLKYCDPDILIAQEVQSQAAVNEFLSQVLNYGQPGTYSAAPFIDGPDTDNALFYKPSRTQYVSHTVLTGATRYVVGYRMRPVGVNADSIDLQIYSVHFRAAEGFETERFIEADTVRNHLNSLPNGGYFIVGGDMNLYTSSEPAYNELIGSQADNSGRTYDPINTPGDWNSNSQFSNVHTQSTRLTGNGDGGATGGLDDRFDFLLLSDVFQTLPGWQYVPGSYTEVGNDGSHYNLSVNDGVNSAVPDSIADALYESSDHLPVMLDVRRQIQPGATLALLLPNGADLLYTGEPFNILWSSQNLSGLITLRLNRDYPSGAWTDIVTGTSNDGAYTWLATGPETVTARVQVVSVSQPSLTDVSDLNFFVQNPQLILSSPNGGESLYTGFPTQIFWGATGFSGNVNIELNRVYPGGSWVSLFTNTANDGVEIWTPGGPITTTARIRISSVFNANAHDTSAADFSIGTPFVTLVSPDGGEDWPVGVLRPIVWEHGGLSGGLKIEINRAYPSVNWELISASTSVQLGYLDWMVTGPVSSTCRARVTMISDTTKRDTSAADFRIHIPVGPPILSHDPHADAAPGAVVFTARVTDDLPGLGVKLHYRPAGGGEFDSLEMNSTSNPGEFAATPLLVHGTHHYFIRVIDSDDQVASTDTLEFFVSEECGVNTGYDDGSAETFSWSQQDSFLWAVKFSPPVMPFVLCEAEIVVAGFHPDSSHDLIKVLVLQNDGPGGLPGTILRSVPKGTVGNIVGGLPGPGDQVFRAVLSDENQAPLEFTGDFFVAVGNVADGTEAFGIDQSSPSSGRSFFLDPCEGEWMSESAVHENARAGNRMIRIRGWRNGPTVVVLRRSGNDLRFHWNPTGAPSYRIYSASSPDGPFNTLAASTSDTTHTVTGIGSLPLSRYFVVVSSSSP